MDANLATSAYLLSSKNNDFLIEYLHLLRAIRFVGRLAHLLGSHATSRRYHLPKRFRETPHGHFANRRRRNRRCIYSRGRARKRRGEFRFDPRRPLVTRG